MLLTLLPFPLLFGTVTVTSALDLLPEASVDWTVMVYILAFPEADFDAAKVTVRFPVI
jgi:hypothetical protein